MGEEEHPMKRLCKAVSLLLALLFLLPAASALADTDQDDAPLMDAPIQSDQSVDQENAPAAEPVRIVYDEGLYRQIQDTYKAAKKRSRRRSFKGYCGAYVANQLVVLGINTSYLSANGKNTYEIYRNMDVTSGGYAVTAYGAKKYTLREALSAIIGQDPSACNILVGFQKGVSKSGRKYGHVLFIHGVRNGNVYYSDSSARTFDEVKYKEGEPIVCSLSAFLDQYAKYKLDGVIHFQKTENGKKTADAQPSMAEETALGSSEKDLAVN